MLACSPGRHGGCRLDRLPEQIFALEIIEALEGPLEIRYCILDSRRCHDQDPECALHDAWTKGRDAAIAALASTSLSDMLVREDEIATLIRDR